VSENPCDAPVHHVRGRDDVRPRCGVRDRRAGQQVQRRVVQDALARHDPAVSVGHVFAQADVGEDEQIGVVCLQGADRLLHDAFISVGTGSLVVFRLGQAEQQDGGQAQRGNLLGLDSQGLQSELCDAGQGGDRAALAALAPGDEQRVY